MASCSEVESWFSVLGAGIAGLRLLKEFGIRTTELEYFIENIGASKIRIPAFAPSPLRNQYESTLIQAETKVKQGIEKISEPNPSQETVEQTLRDAKDLYNMLTEIHRTIISGLVS